MHVIHEIRCDINVKFSKDFLNIFHFLMFFLVVNIKIYIPNCYQIVCQTNIVRGGSRTAATSITKRSILDVAAVLDPPLVIRISFKNVKTFYS